MLNVLLCALTRLISYDRSLMRTRRRQFASHPNAPAANNRFATKTVDMASSKEHSDGKKGAKKSPGQTFKQKIEARFSIPIEVCRHSSAQHSVSATVITSQAHRQSAAMGINTAALLDPHAALSTHDALLQASCLRTS